MAISVSWIDWPGPKQSKVTAKTIERLLGIESPETVKNILDEIVGGPEDPEYDPKIKLEG